MICKTVAAAFSRHYTNNSLNKILYKFNGTFYVLQKIVQIVPDWRNICSHPGSHNRKTLFCIFLKRLHCLRAVINVCRTTIRSILRKHHALVYLTKKTRMSCKNICNLGRISEPRADFHRVARAISHLCWFSKNANSNSRPVFLSGRACVSDNAWTFPSGRKIFFAWRMRVITDI